ncbi:MAG TPA: hypothetical protein VKA53_07960, partial [Thermoanaerobaculia bacterium]|nr:hypothetical protein [Thermoanaerobaculia bacterium]
LATQAGTMMALYAGARAKPAVLSGAGLFERSSGPPPGKVLRTGTLAYAFVQGADPFFWEGRKVEFSYSRGGVVISMPSASKRLTVSTRGLSFVEFAYAAPIRVARGAEDLLAMVLECRSIGNRAVILVLDSDLKILYQERVRTCWRIDRDPLEIWSPDDSGRESIVVGPSCAKPIVLRARQ